MIFVSQDWRGLLDKVVIPMVASPLIGLVLGFAVMLTILWTCRNRNAHRLNSSFRRLQVLSAAAMAFSAYAYALPGSSTHVITSTVMGVGATKRRSAVRWGIAGNIVTAWVLTIPGAALMAAAVFAIGRPLVR
ncbi:MAG: inorganic phosphate transporter [Sciscionella sp.]